MNERSMQVHSILVTVEQGLTIETTYVFIHRRHHDDESAVIVPHHLPETISGSVLRPFCHQEQGGLVVAVQEVPQALLDRT